MRTNAKALVAAVVGLMLLLIIVPQAVAEDPELDDRMRLIEASEQLAAERDPDLLGFKAGLMATNFGAEEAQINPGARLVYYVPQVDVLRLQGEAIYIRDDLSASGFLGAAVEPLRDSFLSPYAGAGIEVGGYANYQVFGGVEVWDNFFLEAKYVSEDDADQNNIYLAVGFQLRF